MSVCPRFVVTKTTPLAARTPYIEAEAASFKTEIFSISFGDTLFKLPSTPSINTIGLLSPKVFIPRIRISTSPSAPGCAEKELTVTPLIRPCSKLEVLDTGISLISLTFTEDTAPVRLAFFCVP